MSRMVSLETRIILMDDGCEKASAQCHIVQPFSRESQGCVVTVYHMHAFFESIHTHTHTIPEDRVGKPRPRCNSPVVQEHPSSRLHRRPVSDRNDHGACTLRHGRGYVSSLSSLHCFNASILSKQHAVSILLNGSYRVLTGFLPGSYRVLTRFL